MSPRDRFTIEERADRWQRRHTGPWRTVTHEVAVLDVTYRYRRRRRIEFVRFGVAWHDLWTHELWRAAIVPALRPAVRWLSRRRGEDES